LALGRAIAQRMPTHPVKAIGAVLAAIGCLAIVSNVIKYFQEYLSDKAAILAVQDIRRRLYDRVLHVPMSHFNLRGASDVTSRLTQDAQELVAGFKTVLGQSIQEPIKVALAFGLAMVVSWKLTMFIVVFGPVMFLIIRKLGKKMRRASRKAMVNSASMLGQIEGSLIGIRVVKGASAGTARPASTEVSRVRTESRSGRGPWSYCSWMPKGTHALLKCVQAAVITGPSGLWVAVRMK